MNLFKSNNLTSSLPKLVGETRHNPPAIKEWSDSVYTYNKNSLRSLPSKDIMANKIIKGYFNLSDCKHLARSKRMRIIMKRFSANKIFISKPELKQTSDNINITVYTLDRERQFLLRKLYHNIRKWESERSARGAPYSLFNSYDYWRNKYNLGTLNKLEKNVLALHTKNNIAKLKLKNKYLLLKNKRLININRMCYLKTRSNIYNSRKIRKGVFFKSSVIGTKKIIKRKNVPYFGIGSSNEAKFLRYIGILNKRSIQARKRLYYSYLTHILSTLGIKVLSFDMLNIKSEKNKKMIQNLHDINNLRYQGKILLFLTSKEGSLGKPEVLSIEKGQENLPYLDKVNLVLSNFVNKILSKNYLIKDENLLLSKYSEMNFKNFLSKEYMQDLSSKNNLNKTKLDSLKKEISLTKDYIDVTINQFKFSKYLPVLKLLMNKIYNKNVQLNIVKLKYLYLNSDIFTEAILLKLRKKTALLKVINKSLKTVKLPDEFNETTHKVNNMHNLNVYKSLKLKNLLPSTAMQDNNIDNLDLVLKNLYPISLSNQKNNNGTNISEQENYSKLMNVINIVKYKWVTGVRLEAAGRLTRRYTASRSVYKYKNKGSLKNTDFSRKLDFLKKSMPVVMLRNNASTNTQYTFAKSKKRIGAFGLKGWISSY